MSATKKNDVTQNYNIRDQFGIGFACGALGSIGVVATTLSLGILGVPAAFVMIGALVVGGVAGMTAEKIIVGRNNKLSGAVNFVGVIGGYFIGASLLSSGADKLRELNNTTKDSFNKAVSHVVKPATAAYSSNNTASYRSGL